MISQLIGSASVHLQMLNKESRSYFQRAYADSGSAFQPYVFTRTDHVQHVQNCSNITETDKLLEYLKTVNSSNLMRACSLEVTPDIFNIVWSAVVESNDTKHAFITKTLEEIYKDANDGALAIDAMFSFTGQEIPLVALNISSSEASKPLIEENVMETTKFTLPFKGFTKAAYPKVNAQISLSSQK